LRQVNEIRRRSWTLTRNTPRDLRRSGAGTPVTPQNVSPVGPITKSLIATYSCNSWNRVWRYWRIRDAARHRGGCWMPAARYDPAQLAGRPASHRGRVVQGLSPNAARATFRNTNWRRSTPAAIYPAPTGSTAHVPSPSLLPIQFDPSHPTVEQQPDLHSPSPLPEGKTSALQTNRLSPPEKLSFDLDKRPKLWYKRGVLFAQLVY
jgi:hypothetical protein